MQRNFSYTLLITWILFTISCKTNFVSTSSQGQNISVSSDVTTTDSQLVELYLPYKFILEKDMKRVISFSNEEMTKNKPESNLTNFLADLLLEESTKEAIENEFEIKPSISYFNYGGIRTFLPKGDISVENIFELMPFENELVYLKLNGKQIKVFLDHVAEGGGDSVGGVHFTISNSKAKKIFIQDEAINFEKEYWLATNDYVAEGGDGLTVFTERSDFKKSGVKIRDVIITHLENKQKKGEILETKLDGRITNE